MVLSFLLLGFLAVLSPLEARHLQQQQQQQQQQTLAIRQVGDAILGETCRDLTLTEIQEDPEIKRVIQAGQQTLTQFIQEHGYGRGLAAPQVSMYTPFLLSSPYTLLSFIRSLLNLAFHTDIYS
jgi:hypothetical protein